VVSVTNRYGHILGLLDREVNIGANITKIFRFIN
jgi:hypothetical protein